MLPYNNKSGALISSYTEHADWIVCSGVREGMLQLFIKEGGAAFHTYPSFTHLDLG